MGEKEECAICYEAIVDKCILLCMHSFCSKCIITLINTTTEFDESANLFCPMCRHEGKIFDIKKENGEKLVIELSTIVNGVYVQGETVGLASYHFPSIENSYISYESPECLIWPPLEDGSRPPPRKYFINPSYNEETKTFKGDIDWSPTKWQGETLWRYIMVFSENLMKIDTGTVEHKNENGAITHITKFGVALFYLRKNRFAFHAENF